MVSLNALLVGLELEATVLQALESHSMKVLLYNLHLHQNDCLAVSLHLQIEHYSHTSSFVLIELGKSASNLITVVSNDLLASIDNAEEEEGELDGTATLSSVSISISGHSTTPSKASP
mmetsp:Transcript_19777/g.30858  ORF Transcript_19777/g.30858 Transcript_19777/m.30858 type:complete len:118 (+) Transcript_19777:126-479(+)